MRPATNVPEGIVVELTPTRIVPGTPTAISGQEFGIKKRLGFLSEHTTMKGKEVLDLGCGYGTYGDVCYANGASLVLGLDSNLESLREAKLIETINSVTEAVPLRESCVDIVLMVEVLEHVHSDRRTLEEVRRVLRKGGILLVTVPNRFYPFETHGMQLGNVSFDNSLGVNIPILSWLPDRIRKHAARARVYTQKDLVRLLHEIGFTVLKVEYMMPPLDSIENPIRHAEFLRIVLTKIEATPLRYLGCHVVALAVPSTPKHAPV